MKYIVEVKVAGDDKWYGNALVFDTREEAEEYGLDLYNHWLSTTDYRVVEKPE